MTNQIDKYFFASSAIEAAREDTLNKAIEMAKKGNTKMLKILLPYFLPPLPKDNYLPEIHISMDVSLAEQGRDVIDAARTGALSLTEAKELMILLRNQLILAEHTELAIELESIKRKLSI